MTKELFSKATALNERLRDIEGRIRDLEKGVTRTEKDEHGWTGLTLCGYNYEVPREFLIPLARVALCQMMTERERILKEFDALKEDA